MRRHMSIFILCVGSKIYRLLLLIAGLFVVNATIGLAFDPFSTSEDYAPIRALLITFLAAVIVCGVICYTGNGKNSVTTYTYNRLRVSQKSLFIWDAVSNCLCFAILYCAETVSLFLDAVLYMKKEGYTMNQQIILMAFYRKSFLHGFLPLDDTVVWIKNGIVILCVAVVCAFASQQFRWGKTSKLSIVGIVVALMLGGFESIPFAGTFFYIMPISMLTVVVLAEGLIEKLKEKKHESDV